LSNFERSNLLILQAGGQGSWVSSFYPSQ
jgi:hypothetical protein